MGDNSVEKSRIKIPKLYAHFHIKERKSTKFQVNPLKNEEVAETRSRMDGRMNGRMDGITHTWTDESFL